MKFTNLSADKDQYIFGVFKDVTRGVKIPAGGSVEFNEARLLPNLKSKLFDSTVIKVEDSVKEDVSDEDFKAATYSIQPTVERKFNTAIVAPGSIAADPSAQPEIKWSKDADKKPWHEDHGLGIEDQTTWIMENKVHPAKP